MFVFFIERRRRGQDMETGLFCLSLAQLVPFCYQTSQCGLVFLFFLFCDIVNDQNFWIRLCWCCEMGMSSFLLSCAQIMVVVGSDCCGLGFESCGLKCLLWFGV